MLCAEEKLSVEVGVVDRVQIDHRDIIEPGEHEILDELAADSASPNNKDLLAFDRRAREALRDPRP